MRRRHYACRKTERFTQTTAKLVLDGVSVKILLYHQGYFEYDCIVELTKVKTCELVNLFKTVDQRISVNEELTGGFGNVEIILKELLYCEERFVVKCVDRATLEDLTQEHFAKSCGKLVNKACYTEVVVADNLLLRVENLADLESNLCLLEGTGKLLYRTLCRI